jgi:hypothetical protein
MPAEQRSDWRVSLCALTAAGVWLYLALFTLSGIPVIRAAWAWDQWVNLEGAMRMLAGQRIYVDFFQYTLPGTEYFYLLFFKIWGARAWIPNAVLLMAGVACFWMSAAICRRLLSGWSVFLPGTLFLIMLLADALRTLDRQKVKYILWDTDLDHPVPSDAPTDHLGPLREYLHRHYALITSFDYCQFEAECQVFERNDLTYGARAPEPLRSARQAATDAQGSTR